jgi:hypothetical protein
MQPENNTVTETDNQYNFVRRDFVRIRLFRSFFIRSEPGILEYRNDGHIRLMSYKNEAEGRVFLDVPLTSIKEV